MQTLLKLNLDKCSEFRTSKSELLTILIHDIQPVNDWLITIHDLLFETICFYWSSTVIKIYRWSGISFSSFFENIFSIGFSRKIPFSEIETYDMSHILSHNLFHYHDVKFVFLKIKIVNVHESDKSQDLSPKISVGYQFLWFKTGDKYP